MQGTTSARKISRLAAKQSFNPGSNGLFDRAINMTQIEFTLS